MPEVLNYVGAMNHGLDRLNELPLSLRLLREIHERLMTGVRGGKLDPGEFRSSQNWIGPSGSTINQATFVPPPPQEMMKGLGEFEHFLHMDASLPALIKIGLVHAQFETIHPFLDSNGRVGRLLITFLLCQREILTKPVLYLSHYLKQHRQQYYDLLQATRHDGDWEVWLKFFLRGVAEVSNKATETARRTVDLRETHRRLITEGFGRVAGNGITVLEQLFQRPIVQVNHVVSMLNITYPPANNLMARFVDARIVEEVTGQARNRWFRYSPYINLFADA